MTDRTFRDALKERLEDELQDRAKELMAAYDDAQEKLEKEVYPEIRSSEPDLTDHGPPHIANVQRNVLDLLPNDNGTDVGLTGAEMYCLAMAILFHDVGNAARRTGHHRNIGAIFDFARNTHAATKREKTLVLRACAAHTGVAADGSSDTLADVPTTDHLHGKAVRLQEIAAILRFADELAEGPQRTSEYRRQQDQYERESRIYHEYASVTHILIDRDHQRILLAYEIPVDDYTRRKPGRPTLKQLLQYTLQRIAKLEQERRYAVHYSPILSPFRTTIASFTFHCDGELLDFDIPKIHLDGLTIPGEDSRPIQRDYPQYKPGPLARQLRDICNKQRGRK